MLYSEQENRFLPDRYVEGDLPTSAATDSARGDQCENCGNLMDATKLINPHNRSNPDDKLVVRSSEHYFLDLTKRRMICWPTWTAHQDHWRPNVLQLHAQSDPAGRRRRPARARLSPAISTGACAVPLEGWEDKRIYVWFEAVNGYFTASVEWAENHGPAGRLERLVV